MPVTIDGSSGITANDGSVFTDTNGRVGIGLTAPASLLSLRGTGDVLRLDTSGSEDQNGVSLRFHQRDTTIINNQGYGGIEWEGSDTSNDGVRGYIKGFSEGTTGQFGLRFGTQGSGASSPVEVMRIANNGAQSSVIPGGSVLLPEFKCRAWVNFDGTGTPSIRASGNVSSITRNGTGQYTVNFATALPDANYAVTTSGSQAQSGDHVVNDSSAGFMTTTSVRIATWTFNGGAANDTAHVYVAIHR